MRRPLVLTRLGSDACGEGEGAAVARAHLADSVHDSRAIHNNGPGTLWCLARCLDPAVVRYRWAAARSFTAATSIRILA